MKPLIFLSFLLQIFCAKAQVNHFIYLQSDTREPFYVMMDGANHSSSPNGYLILSKLHSGTYHFVIGFARDKYPEQNFTCTIGNNDLGYALKPSGIKDWVLVSLKDSSIIKAEQKAVAEPSVKADPPDRETTIIKTLSNTSADGMEEVYIDRSGAKPDTIAIFIPIGEQPIKLSDKKKNCELATNDDFLKTRLQMASATTDAGMIEAVQDAFKVKCFSTEQLKNLGSLILTEENKLALFLSVKKGVYDAQNFKSLQSQFTKAALVQQFKNGLK